LARSLVRHVCVLDYLHGPAQLHGIRYGCGSEGTEGTYADVSSEGVNGPIFPLGGNRGSSPLQQPRVVAGMHLLWICSTLMRQVTYAITYLLLQAIEWMNLCILTPAALLFPYFLLRGNESVRIPAIVVSAFTTYSLVICIGATLFGPDKSADPSTFTGTHAHTLPAIVTHHRCHCYVAMPPDAAGIYLIYLLQPYVVIARFWSDAPFRSISPAFNGTLVLLTSLNFAVFFTYVLKWFVLYQPEVFPAAIVPALQALKSIP
jgi:hypothetical protein